MQQYTPKKFSLPKLEGISEKTIETHLKLYEGYVKHANLLLEAIDEYSQGELPPEHKEKGVYGLTALQRRFAFEFDGMRNHEYYFCSFEGGPTPIIADMALFKAIEKEWGVFDEWMRRFKAIAATRGVGWAMLYYDPDADRLLNAWVDEQHLGHLVGLSPIVPLDMWEHAYLLDHAPADKARYVEAFFGNFNWHTANERLEKAQKRQVEE